MHPIPPRRRIFPASHSGDRFCYRFHDRPYFPTGQRPREISPRSSMDEHRHAAH